MFKNSPYKSSIFTSFKKCIEWLQKKIHWVVEPLFARNIQHAVTGYLHKSFSFLLKKKVLMMTKPFWDHEKINFKLFFFFPFSMRLPILFFVLLQGTVCARNKHKQRNRTANFSNLWLCRNCLSWYYEMMYSTQSLNLKCLYFQKMHPFILLKYNTERCASTTIIPDATKHVLLPFVVRLNTWLCQG